MNSGIRFRPPRVVPSPEVRWVLARAFGPEDEPWGGLDRLDPERAFDLAVKLDLSARVGARTSRQLLEQEIGAETTESFSLAYQAASVNLNCLLRLCHELAALTEPEGSPLILLKGLAMHLTGLTRPGSRNLVDVDVLVSRDRARELQQLLVESGYRPLTQSSDPHQLPPLAHPHGMVLELHLAVRGLQVGPEDWATADGLLGAGLCAPAPGFPPHCFVPQEDILVAHLLVHGLAQHGQVLHSYPFARLVADAVDLGWTPERWISFLEAAHPRIMPDASREEVDAVADLACRLRAGEPAANIVDDLGGAGILLRHMVAALDRDYRLVSELAYVAPADSRRSKAVALMRQFLRRAVTAERGSSEEATDRVLPAVPPDPWTRRWPRLLGHVWRYGRACLRVSTRTALRV